ncbi:MAG: hypothetical protein D4R88_06790 [Methanosarcinales archaeon]|nr:MAG: hypothetical protein D4R88_06790 [Methanosarcinales archaeon]
MIQICQTLSGKSKFVSMSKSNIQTLEIVQTASAQSEATFQEPKINQSIYVNNELKRTRTNSNCMSSFQFVPVRCLNYLWNRRIFMNPRASASTVTPVDCVHTYASALAYVDVYSAQSVFYRGVSAFIGVHLRLIYRTAPAERR